jgi:hypothetical protein
MKKVVLFLLLLASVASPAQQSGSGNALPTGTLQTSVNFPTARIQTPNASDLYCAGFIGKQLSSKDKYVTGGLESPAAARFANGDAVYLSGKGYEAGQQYTIVRELTDPNRYELFKGQWSALKAAGLPYQELARVKVIDVRGKTAIAQVEFSCDAVVPGDFAVPFVEKPASAFHAPIRFDRFVPSNGQLSGRILLAKDFDSELANGSKVYVNIGASQGLKVGDFLRAVRTYTAEAHDPVDSLSLKASSTEVTQTRQAAVDPDFLTKTGGPVIHVADMPRRAVAEIVIVGTTPSTATGMIVYSMEPVLVGDGVELDPQ